MVHSENRKPQQQKAKSLHSVVVFRLSTLWLALETSLFKEVTSIRSIHRIPHFNSETIPGLVNLNGELTVCIGLHTILNLNLEIQVPSSSLEQTKRLIVIESKDEKWAFSADQIDGVHHLKFHEPKSALNESIDHFFKGTTTKYNKVIHLLDEGMLINSFKKCLKR